MANDLLSMFTQAASPPPAAAAPASPPPAAGDSPGLLKMFQDATSEHGESEEHEAPAPLSPNESRSRELARQNEQAGSNAFADARARQRQALMQQQQAQDLAERGGSAPEGAVGNAINAGMQPINSLANLALRGVGAATGRDMSGAIKYNLMPADTSRLSGKIGGGLGMAAEGLMSGGAAAPLFGAQAGENEYENIENRRAQGYNISGVQAAADVGGQALLNAGLGYVAPGGRLTKGLFGDVVNPTVGGSLLRTGAHAFMGGTELAGVSAAGQQIRQATGVVPDANPTEGLGESFLTGALFQGLPAAGHEALAHLSAAPQQAPAPVAPPTPEFGMKTPEEMDQLVARAKAAPPLPEPTPASNPLKSARLQEAERLQTWAKEHGEKVPEVTPELHPEGTTRGPLATEAPAAKPLEILQGPHQEHAPVAEEAPEQAPEPAGRPNVLQQAAGNQAVREEYGTPIAEKAPAPVAEEAPKPNVFQTAAEKAEAQKAIEPVPSPHEETAFQKIAREGAERMAELAGGEEGTQRINIAGPGSIYHEEVRPVLHSFADFLSKGTEAFKSVFPVETYAADKKAVGAFRANMASGRNAFQRTAAAFEDAWKGFGRMSKDENLDVMRRMYNGDKQATPELQTIADRMYEDTNNDRKELESLGHEAAKEWTDRKFRMLWKKAPADAQSLITRLTRPGKLGGPANFLKQKTLGDFDEGFQKGLIPVHDNLVDQFLATKMEHTRFVSDVKAMKDLAESGQFRREAKPSPGWSEVPDGAKGILNNILKDKVPQGEGVLTAPDGVNRILANQVNPSLLQGGWLGSIKDKLQGVNNFATQMLLGLSSFHVKTTAMNVNMMQNARAFDLMAHGEKGEAPGAMGQAMTDLVTNIHRGVGIQRRMLGIDPSTPEQAAVQDAMLQGGMSAKADSAYETKFRKRFNKAVQDGGMQGIIRAAAYSPFATIEGLAQHGVFDYVQHNKLAVGADMVGDYLRQNPQASKAQIREAAGKISDHLDNVLGLMERDNLFWNRTMRDVATLGTLSVGWNYGSGRALAGGIVDLGQGIHGLATGSKLSDLDTRRISYLATMATTTAMAGAVATYMATGKGPQALKDYIFPESGNKDRDGHDIRYNIGSYAADYYKLFTHPIDTLTSKASPLVHAASDLIRNRDYAGDKIYDTHGDDAFHYRVATDIAKYLGKTNLPITVQTLMNTINGGGSADASLTEKLLPVMGFSHAPISLSESPAELEAHEMAQESGHTSKDTPEHRATLARLTNLIRDKKPEALGEIQNAIHEGAITPKDAGTIHHRAAQPGGLQGLIARTADVRGLMSRVFPKMSPEEIQANQFVIRRHIAQANIPVDEKQDYLKQLNDAVGRKK